jgi:hypothetical protein
MEERINYSEYFDKSLMNRADILLTKVQLSGYAHGGGNGLEVHKQNFLFSYDISDIPEKSSTFPKLDCRITAATVPHISNF